MKLVRETARGIGCFYNSSKSASIFTERRLKKQESTRLNCISRWLRLRPKLPRSYLLLGSIPPFHGFAAITQLCSYCSYLYAEECIYLLSFYMLTIDDLSICCMLSLNLSTHSIGQSIYYLARYLLIWFPFFTVWKGKGHS